MSWLGGHGLLLLALCGSACLACDASEALRQQQSAAAVAHAEELLRAAPNSEKARGLSLLTAPCFGEEACDVQRRCHAAYALHIEGVSLTQAARQKLADGLAAEAAQLLGAAQEKVQHASVQVADCTDRASALRRRHKS